MQRRMFGPTGREVAVIGMGTWNFEQAPRAAAIAALRRGLDLGMDPYRHRRDVRLGRREELVGEAIAGRRDEVFLVSKVLPHNASRAGTRTACERSLARLRTDRLDCYLLHWRGSHPLAETIAAFDELRREGKILSWGVSNFDTEDLEEALKLAGGPIACNQVALSPARAEYRACGDPVVRAAQGGGGRLQPVRPRALSRPADRRRPRACRDRRGRSVRRRVRQRSPFWLRRPSVFAIPKAADPQHAEENAASGDLHLSAEQARPARRRLSAGPPPARIADAVVFFSPTFAPVIASAAKQSGAIPSLERDCFVAGRLLAMTPAAHSNSRMTSSTARLSPGLARILAMRPSRSARSTFSIFIASTIASASPALTSWPWCHRERDQQPRHRR